MSDRYQLHFEGDLNLWLGAALALLAATGIYLLYRRETRYRAQRLAILLPIIRALAVAMIVLLLTGPILRGSLSMANLSRVVVFVDGSRSMNLTDETMQPDRKLLNARRLGWINRDAIDTDLYDAAQLLASVRKRVEGATGEETLRHYQRFISVAIQTLGEDEPLRKRMEDSLRRAIDRIKQQLDDETYSNRHLDEDLQALVATSQQWRDRLELEHQQRTRESSPSDRQVDDVTDRLDQLTRWQRAEAALLSDNAALLPNLAAQHHVDVLTLSDKSDDGKPTSLWQPAAAQEFPNSFDPIVPSGQTTDLATQVAHWLDNLPTTQRLAVVMLSDGQHNHQQFQRNRGSGNRTTPLHLAQLLGRRGVPIFPIGFGVAEPPADLAIMAIQAPESVFALDRIKGDIVVKDHMPPGKPADISIKVEGQTVWSDQWLTTGSGTRTIEFDFAIKELVEARLAESLSQVDSVSLALPMVVEIEPLDDEMRDDNNSYGMSVRAITRPRRALLIDGRPRWEYRYLRNLFDRDQHWSINDVLVQHEQGRSWLPRGSGPGNFPSDKTELFSYDVVILGEVPPDLLRAPELEWLTDFVGVRGGGLMFIDGQRGEIRHYSDTALRKLLPVRWTATNRFGVHDAMLALTARGLATSALALGSSSEQSAELWNRLPSMRWVAPTESLPGCETLITASNAQRSTAALVLRRFGSGTVLYSGFDESWRWRYEVADQIHSRYWNQIATFIMESPFAVHDRFVSIDTGGFAYQPGESANLKVRLRDQAGQPVSGATADAILYQDGTALATIPLTASDGGDSVLRGTSQPLEPGTYQVGVRAEGFDESIDRVRADFIVFGDATGEMNVLCCNEELLRQMAELSGGQYLREEDAARLPDLLAPHADLSEESREIVLWRSWYWFLPLVGLFTVEWVLRKRLGMM